MYSHNYFQFEQFNIIKKHQIHDPVLFTYLKQIVKQGREE